MGKRKIRVHMWSLYPPENVTHFSPEMFDELERDIIEFTSKGSILLGDFNSWTGRYSDHISAEGESFLILSSNRLAKSFVPTVRNNYDNVLKYHE